MFLPFCVERTISSISRAGGRVPVAQYILCSRFTILLAYCTISIFLELGSGLTAAAHTEEVPEAPSQREIIFRADFAPTFRARSVGNMTRSNHSRKGSHTRTRWAHALAGYPKAPVRLTGPIFDEDDDVRLAYDLMHGEEAYGEEAYMAGSYEDYYNTAASDDACLDLRALSVDEGSVLLLQHQASASSSGSWQDVVSEAAPSEWSAISVAESSWEVPTDVPLPPGPTRELSWCLDDDAALARKLQQEEWNSLLPASSRKHSERSALGCTFLMADRQAQAPASAATVAVSAMRRLRAGLGRCVVCRDSLALIAWEPCGHLALCGACYEQIDQRQRHACVLCRTPGEPIHILQPRRPEKGSTACQDAADDDECQGNGWGAEWGAGLRVDADNGRLDCTTPRFYRDAAEKLRRETPSKLALRRAKQALNQLGKQYVRRTHHFYEQHPWMEQEVPAPYSYGSLHRHCSWRKSPKWTAYADHMSPQALLEELQAHGVQRITFSDCGATSSHLASYAKRGIILLRMLGKRGQVQMANVVKAEEAERQAWLRRVARQAEKVSDKVCGTCRTCHEHSACMLVLRCGHITACRECWEAQKELKRCAECGGESKLALQIFQPLS